MNIKDKFLSLKKLKQPGLHAIFLIAIIIVAWFFLNLLDFNLGLNYVLFSFFLVCLWVLLTLLNINKEAVAILAERKIYNKTEGGGEKPKLNWGMLVFRSFVLLIIFVLIIYLIPGLIDGAKTPLK